MYWRRLNLKARPDGLAQEPEIQDQLGRGISYGHPDPTTLSLFMQVCVFAFTQEEQTRGSHVSDEYKRETRQEVSVKVGRITDTRERVGQGQAINDKA